MKNIKKRITEAFGSAVVYLFKKYTNWVQNRTSAPGLTPPPPATPPAPAATPATPAPMAPAPATTPAITVSSPPAPAPPAPPTPPTPRRGSAGRATPPPVTPPPPAPPAPPVRSMSLGSVLPHIGWGCAVAIFLVWFFGGPEEKKEEVPVTTQTTVQVGQVGKVRNASGIRPEGAKSVADCILLADEPMTFDFTVEPGKWISYCFPGSMEIDWIGTRLEARFKARLSSGKEYIYTPEHSDGKAKEPIVDAVGFTATGAEPERIHLKMYRSDASTR